MNPHLHRHLYSDLPGYKLGRSSGILSRVLHGKLQLAIAESFFPIICMCVCVCECVYVCAYLQRQVKSHDYVIPEKHIGPLSLSVYYVSLCKTKQEYTSSKQFK